MLLEIGLIAALAASDANEDTLLAVTPDEVSKLWVMKKSSVDLTLNFRPDFKAGCAVATYVIESNGKPSNVRVVRSVPEGDVTSLAKQVVGKLRFEPSAANKERTPVYTWMSVSFNPGQQPEAPLGSHIAPKIDFNLLESACRVKGFSGLEASSRANEGEQTAKD